MRLEHCIRWCFIFAAISLAVPQYSEAKSLECEPLRIVEPKLGEIKHRRGLLWKIEKPGDQASVQPSHLFGTIHISDPRVTKLSPAIETALAESRSFSMEVLMDMNTVLSMATLMNYQDGQTLEQHAGKALFRRVVELLKPHGLSRDMAITLKPWAAFLTISVPPQTISLPLDMLLMMRAQLSGQATYGLETLAEQIDVFESLSLDDQIDLLRESVCHHEIFKADIESLIELYVARDLAGMLSLSLRYDSANQERFLDALLWQRNGRMLKRMIPRLQEGGAFVAVGALHLPGQGGLLDLLEKAGYQVTAIY